MNRTQLIGKVVGVLREFLGFNSDASLLRNLRSPAKRLLRLESLEGRDLLSATTLVSHDAEELAASSSLSSQVFIISTPRDAPAESIDYSFATKTSATPEDDDMASLANVEIEWESFGTEIVDDATFESEEEDNALHEVAHDVSTFEVDGVTYVLFEELDLYHASLVNDQRVDESSQNPTNLGRFFEQNMRSGGSGGSTEPEPWTLTVTSSCTSLISELECIEGISNPLLERRGLNSGGGDPLNGADYVEITLPALPDYYVGTVTVSGDRDSYLLYPSSFMSTGTGTTRQIEYSGGSTSFYLVPCNDATPEANAVITVTLDVEPMYDSGGGDWIPEYDFTYVNQTTFVTVVDDDQWLISAVVENDEALEGNPDVTGCVPTNGSFNIVRSMNSDASYYNYCCSGYTLDQTYSISVITEFGGTATKGTDYNVLDGNNGNLSTVVEFSGNTMTMPVTVVPIEDRLFEANEIVTLSLSNPRNEAGQNGENTLPQYDIGTTDGLVTIYQAPEFIMNNGDQGGSNTQINKDKFSDFHYGKPVVNETACELLASSQNNIRYEIVSTTPYFEVDEENGVVTWKAVPDHTCTDYSFSFTARVIDCDRPGLYDEVNVTITCGWATFTACVIQPVPGEATIFNGDAEELRRTGHAFWTIEATQSLVDYCNDKYDSTNPYSGYTFDDTLSRYCNSPLGYYPQNVSVWRLMTTDDGVLRSDLSHMSDVSAYSSFIIQSETLFLNGLVKCHSVALDPGIYRLRRNGNTPGHNCVDVTIEVASSCGINLNAPEVNERIWYGALFYDFVGHAPGPFGEWLVSYRNGTHDSYTLGSTLVWG